MIDISRAQLLWIILILTIVPIAWWMLFRHLRIFEHSRRADFYQRKPVVNAQWIRVWVVLVLLTLLLWRSHIAQWYMRIYLITISVLALTSTVDLFHPLPSRLRLLIQLAVFSWVIGYGWVAIDTIRLVGGDVSVVSRLSVLGSIIRFGLCTNAINRFDGIESQASWVTSIWSFVLLMVVSFIVLPSYGSTLTPEVKTQLEITQIIALSLGLTSLVYTFFEYKPRGLIRDIGTTIYGFSLAYIALLWGAKVGTLVVVLSLVLFDSVWVVINRFFVKHKNPLQGDYTHLHHRLIRNGRTRKEARRFARIRSWFLAILMLLQKTSSINKWIIFVMMACLFFGINIYLFRIKKLPDEMEVHFRTKDVEKLE